MSVYQRRDIDIEIDSAIGEVGSYAYVPPGAFLCESHLMNHSLSSFGEAELMGCGVMIGLRRIQLALVF